MFVDSDLKAIETVTRTQSTDNRTQIFMQLSGLQGSVLEHRIFEEDWQVPSVSTAKLFQLINSQQGTEILKIDKTNIATILPTLPFDNNIKEDIQTSVNQNLVIHIASSEITYEDWRGIGYIKENTETGEAGYMLSGMIGGGMTVETPEEWVNQYLAQTLGRPYTGEPSKDPVARLIKIPVTDGLTGTAGKPLSQPLAVLALDKKGRPVQGAKIIFKVIAGGGDFGKDPSGNPLTTYEAITDRSGIAKLGKFYFGKKTSDNPTYYWSEKEAYPQKVGLNEIDTFTDTGISISTPFYEYGFPGEPDHITKTFGDGQWGAILSFVGFISILIEDENNNPIANLPITFESLNARHNADPPNCNNPYMDTRQALLTTTDDPCIKNAPMYGECPNAESKIDIKTNTQGTAAVQVILGGSPDAIYSITATCTDPRCANLNATFNLYSYYHDDCDEGHAPKNPAYGHLHISSR